MSNSPYYTEYHVSFLSHHIDSLNDDHAIQKRAECEYKVLRVFDTSPSPASPISCALKKIGEPRDEANSTQLQGGDTAEATVLLPATGLKVRSSSLGKILKLVKQSSARNQAA